MRSFLAGFLALFLSASAVLAQQVTPVIVLNGSSVVSGSNPLPITGSGGTTNAAVAPAAPTATNSNLIGCQFVTAGVAFTNLQQGALSCDARGNLLVNTIGSQASITGNGSGTTGAVVGTLAGVASKTTYMCGFDVSAVGGTAAVGPVVVAGLVGGSFTYQLFSSASGVIFSRTFTPCVPASAVNTAITVTTTADGTATAVNVNAFGYQQ